MIKFLFLINILCLSNCLLGQDCSYIFINPEIPAQYKSGNKQLLKDIQTNLKYPNNQTDVTGKVYVSFTIDTTGKIINPKTKRGIHDSFNNEALKMLNLLGEWTPGEQHGKKVNTEMILPISFHF